MNSIFFMILRRMRAPLISIIVSFAIAVIGLTLMPGLDAAGKPWHMSVFEAFYVISYTATTIGFGELPYLFTNEQRLWMTFSIYLTVIPWFYAIGTIITLFQDASLRHAITSARFASSVAKLHEPFYLVCGYGETGSLLVKALDRNELRAVVVEVRQDRINELELEDYQFSVPSLCADAKMPEVLLKAGLKNPMCRGVAAMTDDDHVNLTIAVGVKLINPNLMVVARAENDKTAANMASFGTDHIINPFTIFGEHLAIEMHALGTYLLHEWLTGVPGDSVKAPACPPIGKWIVCGYGRFGKSVVENLHLEKNTTVIIEADPVLTQCNDCIVGSGTESEVLREASVEEAVGIVAGTNNDINNLSIVMTAFEINPNLFVVIRKNKRYNDVLFEHFNADITMDPSDIIAHECLAYMVSPLLAQFLLLSRGQSNDWANRLISRLVETMGEAIPETWAIEINQQQAPAVMDMLSNGQDVTLETIIRDPANRETNLSLVPLMLQHNHRNVLLPDPSTRLAVNDRILFCGHDNAKLMGTLILNDQKTLSFIVHGHEIPNNMIGRWIAKLESITGTQ